MIEIIVRLDENDIQAACARALSESFATPSRYSSDGGEGYKKLRRQVIDHVLTLDLSAMVAEATTRKLASVVDEVVSDLLRESVKKRAREMKRDGQLQLPT